MKTKFKLFIVLIFMSSCNGHISLLGDIISSTNTRLKEVADGIIGGITHALTPPKDETVVIIVEKENNRRGDYVPQHNEFNDPRYHNQRPYHNRPEVPYHHGNGEFNNHGNNYNNGPHNNYENNPHHGFRPNHQYPNYPNQEFSNEGRPRCPPNQNGYNNMKCMHNNFGGPQYPQGNHNNENYNGHYPGQNEHHGNYNPNENNERPNYPQQNGNNGYYNPNGDSNYNGKPDRPNSYNNNQQNKNKFPYNSNGDQLTDEPKPEYSTNEPVSNLGPDTVTRKPNDDIPLFIPLLPSDDDEKSAPKRDTQKSPDPVVDSDDDFKLDVRFKT